MPRTLALVLLTVLGLTGCTSDDDGDVACDPWIGASGDVVLDSAVDPADFGFLQVAAFPRSSLEDHQVPDPSTVLVYRDMVPLAETSFPAGYEATQFPGASTQADWRVVAWLSADETSLTPASGDPYRAADFELADCSGCVDDHYCDITTVNLVIDRTAP